MSWRKETENMEAEEKKVEREEVADAPGDAICGRICKGLMPHTCVEQPGR